MDAMVSIVFAILVGKKISRKVCAGGALISYIKKQ
jgi:hypothetical protein